MLPETHSFLIRGEDGQEYGPVNLEELRDWVQENRAGLGTEVRLDEPNAPWHPWQNYPELVALLAEVHVTSPVPGQPGLVLAPVWRRMIAYGLDLILAFGWYLPIFMTVALTCLPDFCVRYALYINAMSVAPQPTFAPFELLSYEQVTIGMIFNLVLALFFTGFHIAHGQTPAKALLRLRVVDQFGQKPGPLKAFLRAFVMICSMSLLFLPIAYAFFNPQRRALHDFIAGTYVVEA
jgi:uncharacterized RDD family membrane protein YckC